MNKLKYAQVETHRGQRILCEGKKMSLNEITRVLNDYSKQNFILQSRVNYLEAIINKIKQVN